MSKDIGVTVKSLESHLRENNKGLRGIPTDEYEGVQYASIGFAVITQAVNTRLHCLMSSELVTFTHRDNSPSAMLF